MPEHIWAGDGSKVVAQAVRDSIAAIGPKTACREPGSPWEGDHPESLGLPVNHVGAGVLATSRLAA